MSHVTLQLPIMTWAFPNVTLGSSHPLWRAFFPKVSEIPPSEDSATTQPGLGCSLLARGQGTSSSRASRGAEAAPSSPPAATPPTTLIIVGTIAHTAHAAASLWLPPSGPHGTDRPRGLATYLVLPENHQAQGAENRDF